MIQVDSNNQRPLCLACEEMLVDAIDETLSPADQAFFDRHVSTCTDCTQRVADARRGAAWLELLKSPRPEPSAMLMERILAQTSGLEGDQAHEFTPVVVGQPAILPSAIPPRSNVLAFRPRMPKFASWTSARFEPRLAMTAAMAFFSIALTLNLTGVRLDQLNARSLRPDNVKRSYYEASADVVRYYDNLRVVRVMESRVDNLRQVDSEHEDEQQAPAPKPEAAPQPEKKQQKKQDGPISRSQSPIDRPRFLVTDQAIAQGNTGSRKTNKEGGLA